MDELCSIKTWDAQNIKKAIKSTAISCDCPFAKIGMPFRVALTSKEHSPDISHVAEMLGKETVFRRVVKMWGDNLNPFHIIKNDRFILVENYFKNKWNILLENQLVGIITKNENNEWLFHHSNDLSKSEIINGPTDIKNAIDKSIENGFLKIDSMGKEKSHQINDDCFQIEK